MSDRSWCQGLPGARAWAALCVLALGGLGGACGTARTPAVRVVALPRAETTAEAFERLPGVAGQATVTLLDDNAAAWAARWALVREARREIALGTFIFTDDVFGRALLGRLIERARAGVHVQLLVDGRGSLGLSLPAGGRDDLEELVAAGAEVRVFNPPWRQALGALVAQDAVAVSAGHHSKVLVVDGARAIVGGRNVAALSFLAFDEDRAAVYDADVLLDGAAAARLVLAAFTRDFAARPHDDVVADVWNLRAPGAGLALLARAMDAWLDGRIVPTGNLDADRHALRAAVHGTDDAAQQPDDDDDALDTAEVRDALARLVACRSVWGALRRADATTPSTSWGARGEADVRVVTTPGRVAQPDGDDDGTANPATEALLLALAGARRSVVLETPSFILSPALLLALQAASARGVDVTVLTNGPRSSDSRIAQALFVDSWPELVARVPRLRIFVPRDAQMRHGKRAVFDDALVFVGSFNVDPFSVQMNSEAIVALWSAPLARTVRAELAARRAAMLEYRVARRPDGVVRRQPKGTGREGAVVVLVGPAQQVAPDELARLARVKALLLAVRSWYDFDVLVW
jgi:phosphatidylserine/phosphatidylglycerophosphate/cardiolipin synthase-like enzyme